MCVCVEAARSVCYLVYVHNSRDVAILDQVCASVVVGACDKASSSSVLPTFRCEGVWNVSKNGTFFRLHWLICVCLFFLFLFCVYKLGFTGKCVGMCVMVVKKSFASGTFVFAFVGEWCWLAIGSVVKLKNIKINKTQVEKIALVWMCLCVWDDMNRNKQKQHNEP